MRPLQLSFSGIRSYPGTVGPLDFADKTLIGIVGDTGAGKSTILEAVSLALYGNCTWNEREHKGLMAEGADRMTVDFTFAHDGQRWRVRRVYHANTTPASHLLENLDTGEQTDGKRAVNIRIVALLQLTFDSFKTAVLLPQGKFDRLLTATGAERTGLLKSIFGVPAVEAVRALAARHRDQLTSLVHQAELTRRGLLNDPAATAAREGAEAAEAARVAKELQGALRSLQTLRAEASAAHDRYTEITAAADALKQHETRDTAAELAAISAADAEIGRLEASAVQERQQWIVQRENAKEKLAAAALKGFTAESLASAATLLDALPGKIAALAEDQARLDADDVALSEEAGKLAGIQARLADMRTTVDSLAQAHTAATTEHQAYRDAHRDLEDAVRTVLHRAVGAAKAQREEERALREANDRASTIAGLGKAAEAASGNLEEAEDHVSRIRSQEAAHTAGAHLAPGEPCLICRRPLPGDYEPPVPTDPEALSAARSSVTKAKTADRRASDKLADAKGKAEIAQQAYSTRRSETQTARNRLEQARQAAAAVMHDLARRRPVETGTPGEPAFEQVLDEACSRLAATAEEEQDALLGTLLPQVLSPAIAVEQQLSAAAAHAGEEARQAQADTEKEAHAVSLRRENHEKNAASLKSARHRHQRQTATAAQELTSMPEPLRQMLPSELLSITPEDAQQARRAVTREHEQVAALTRLRDEAADKSGELTETLRQLDLQRDENVSSPLRSIATYLERWQDLVEQAIRSFPGDASPPSVPARPATVSVDEISSYAAALVQADDTVAARLSQAADAAAGEASTRLAKLHAAARRLAAGKAGLAVSLPEGNELLAPSSLDALVSAKTTKDNEAAQHRASQAVAAGQVEEAASLDAALRDGRARLNAVQALHGLLADARFLQYLTDRRTRALLAEASTTFETLSRGEFGFGEDFQIVSRRSGAARSPETLSGGENFLASLALALALVELHSRAGGRLGALFLDEGFASLDVDSLTGALAVLQSETGGEKLVAVISHLHAVAEAAEDVLWVERGPAGSAARWLSAQERDALVRQEVTGGMLNLL